MKIFLRLNEPVPVVPDWTLVEEIVIESPMPQPGMVELISTATKNRITAIVCSPAAKQWYEEHFHTAN